MLNIVVYNIVVKAVELLTLPSHSKILDLVFLLATPLSLPEKKFKATDVAFPVRGSAQKGEAHNHTWHYT